MNKKNVKTIIILIISIAILVGIYFLLNAVFKDGEENDTFLKNYKVNEYISTYVSEEDMVNIYLNDYIYIMYSDIDKAYNLLDEEYRNKKFGNIENYKEYVNSLTYQSYTVDKYYKVDKNGYTLFEMYDKNGNFFAFKTTGVLQYTVYLDDYTIELG